HGDLAVADLAGARRLGDGVDDAVDLRVVDHHLDAGLGHEVDLVLGAPVDLGVPALTAEAPSLDGGETGDADLAQRLLHVLELERLDDGDDELHGDSLLRPAPTLPARRMRARCFPGVRRRFHRRYSSAPGAGSALAGTSPARLAL